MTHAMALLRSTYGSRDDARAAAARLIERRVAACVHVHPIWSTYRWQGDVEAEEEWMLEARTPSDDRDACWDALLDGHPYDEPLVEVLGESLVSASYAAWAERCTRRG